MNRTTHIPRTSALARMLLPVLILVAGLFVAKPAAAQSTDPDVVCQFSDRRYWVDSTAGSTYTWSIDGTLMQTGTIAMFKHNWPLVGDFVVTVQEITAQNCPGLVKTMPVHVYNAPPTFNVPLLDDNYCVEDITQAVYQPGGSYDLGTDILPPRPNYYYVPPGSTLLNITGITDDCPGGVTIDWEIDFPGPPVPDLTGTGQIETSMPAAGIQFPVGTSTITWTVTDTGGNTVVHSVTLVVLPRPEIGDITP